MNSLNTFALNHPETVSKGEYLRQLYLHGIINREQFSHEKIKEMWHLFFGYAFTAPDSTSDESHEELDAICPDHEYDSYIESNLCDAYEGMEFTR